MTKAENSFNVDYRSPFLSMPGLKRIEVAEGNPNYYAENGVLYYTRYFASKPDGTFLALYPTMKDDETFIQPDNTYIVRGALKNVQYLKRVENFDGASDSFKDSSVEEVVCAKTKDYFQDRQFNGDYIRKITISEGAYVLG